jgi:hypothetical protein
MEQQLPNEGHQVAILRDWKSWFPGDEPHFWKDTPSGGPIATPEAWAALWRPLGQQPEHPVIDFSRELVLAAGGPGPNGIHLRALTIDAQGDLTFAWAITEMWGPGFSYRILVVDRTGVKTVNGAPLDAPWFPVPDEGRFTPC